MKSFIDYLEQPSYINLKIFCEKYIEFSEYYWSLSNELQHEAIKKAEEQVYIDKAKKNLKYEFENMDDNQIQAHFHKLKIDLYENIDEHKSILIKNEIDKLLIKNLVYANKLKLKIPKDKNLKVKQYYINYIIIQKILPYISMKANKGLKK